MPEVVKFRGFPVSSSMVPQYFAPLSGGGSLARIPLLAPQLNAGEFEHITRVTAAVSNDFTASPWPPDAPTGIGYTLIQNGVNLYVQPASGQGANSDRNFLYAPNGPLLYKAGDTIQLVVAFDMPVNAQYGAPYIVSTTMVAR